MQAKSVDIGRAFSVAFDAFKHYPGVIIGVSLLSFLLSVIGPNIPILSILYVILIQPAIQGGLAIFWLNVVNDTNPTVGDLFAGFRQFGKWMGVYWLLAAAVAAALIPAGIGVVIGILVDPDTEGIFLVPAALGALVSVAALITVMLRWMFIFYAAAQGRSTMEAFAWSAELTDGVRPQLFWAAILLGLFSVCGIIVLFVGVIVTSAIASCALVVIYRDLKAAMEPTAAALPALGPAPGVTPTPGPAPPAPTVPSSVQWYLVLSGQQVGPVSHADLVARVQVGEVTGETLVWRDGMADWVPAGQLPELAPVLAGPPGGGPPS